jgi:hypothetical protein
MRERCLQSALLVVGLFAGSSASACRGEPAPSVAPATTLPAREPKPGVATPPTPASPPAPSVAAEGPAAAPPPAAVGLPSASSAPSASGAAADDPPLVGADGTPLPQTEARPSVTDQRFKQRMQRVADAILTGNSAAARVSFFPLVAYAQVKDVQKPERDYRYRLLANFERDVREYRKLLGRDAEGAEFLGVDVPDARVEWMKPGKEGNRLGYFRVLRSKLRFRLSSGKERSLELTSLISWRGEWYVVHLHGFE